MSVCTVAIPVYNQRAFIARAVRSALEQDLPALEVIVVDNCSDDGTWEELQPFAARGVKLHRNAANLGLFGNFNRCLELAGAPFLRFLSGDDVLEPGCLRAEVELMERHESLAMLGTRGRFVSAEGGDLGAFADEMPAGIYGGGGFAAAWFSYYARYRRNPLNYPSGVLFRRSAIGALRFEPGWRTAGDIDFYFKVLGQGDLGIAASTGCRVTRHAAQAHVTPNLDGTAIREQIALLERHLDTERGAGLKKYLAGACLALALRRCFGAATRASAAIHWRLARELGPGLPAAVLGLASLVVHRAAQALLGSSAPHVPRPSRPLA